MSGRTIAISSIYLAGQSVLLNALSLFSSAYIIRTLGPVSYGAWATAAGLTAVNGAIASFGLRPLFVRAVSQRSSPAKVLLSQQLGVRIVLGLLAGALAVLVSILLNYPAIVVTCAIVSSISLVLTVVWTVFGDYLQAGERFKTYATVSFLSGLILTVSSVIAVWFGGRAVALSWAYVTGPLTSVIVFAAILHRRGELAAPTLSVRAAMTLLRESRSIAGSQVLATLRDRSEQLIVPKVVGIGPFGYYAGSVMPADRLYIVPDAIATAYYPRLAGRESSDIDELARRLVSWVVVSTVSAAALLYISAPLIANVLYPSARQTSVGLIRISCLGMPAAGLATAFAYALQAAGEHRIAARRTAVFNVFGLLTTIGCVWSFGLSGAIWAWALKHVLLATGLWRPFSRRFKMAPILTFKAISLLALLLGATWMLQNNDPRFGSTFWRAFGAALVFGSLGWAYRRSERQVTDCLPALEEQDRRVR